MPDPDIDVLACCRRAEELFELYQICANRKHVETICASYLRSLEATKLSITGHMGTRSRMSPVAERKASATESRLLLA